MLSLRRAISPATDDERADAFLEAANDKAIDAVWFARGGYGAGRVALRALHRLDEEAARKTYLGYSDTGALLAGLYTCGFREIAHGPMPADLNREGGEEAVEARARLSRRPRSPRARTDRFARKRRRPRSTSRS